MGSRVTAPVVRARKVASGADPLVMVTAYDAPGARMADDAGVDLLLVGDSLAMVVLGHLGLTPQSVHAMGGFKVQGKELDAAQALLADAEALVAAGVFAIVLEGVPDVVAKRITDAVPVPTIGIGAGRHCDGQVLVFHD